MPTFDGRWIIPPELQQLLMDDLEERKPEVIVEFGSGMSTLLFASHSDAEVIAIDESEKWAENTRQALKGAGLTATVLTRECVNGFYDLSPKDFPKKIDLVLVDGPSGACLNRSREKAFYWVETRMRRGGKIWVDDARRKDTKLSVRNWKLGVVYHYDFKYHDVARGIWEITRD